MIIIHLSTEMPMGGGERQLLYLYQGLMEKNSPSLEQYIICAKDSQLEAYCQKHQYKYFSLKRRGGFSLHYSWQLKKIIKNIIDSEYGKNSVPVILHCHDGHAHTYAVLVDILLRCSDRISLAIVLSKKVVPPMYKKGFKTLKYNYKGIKKIICVSQAIADVCTTFCMRRSSQESLDSKICVIYDTLDIRQYFPRQTHPIFTIGIIASLLPVKNHELFLAIARQLVDILPQPVNFWIIGDGVLRASLEERVKVLNLTSQVTFWGFREDIPELFSQLDILLVTSNNEGLCSTILQAMAAKVPVIARDVGGIPEIIQHQKNGLLAHDINDFVQGVMNLYQNPSLSIQLTESAYQTVQAYDLPHFIKKMQKIYEAVPVSMV